MVREVNRGLTVSRSSTSGLARAPGAPYGKPVPGSSQQPPPATAVPNGGSHLPRLTINNFATFHARQKKLPPDANTKAAVNTKLWQFPERVCFSCVKCRRDNIHSDSVAVDLVNGIILCTACFTRIIRPRTYRPSRVVPFPSLLSWLNYKPSKVMDVSEDVLSRPAEAVAPSGDRMAVPTLSGGDQSFNINKLPAIAMNTVPTSSITSKVSKVGASGTSSGPVHTSSAVERAEKHPCLRIWGNCQHGGTCLFRNAPFDLCLAYLMGLCRVEEEPNGAPSRDENGTKCPFLHQMIYDLPNKMNPPPMLRHKNDLEDEDSAWAQWVRCRKNSRNSAEWQLWNNGPIEGLLDMYTPVAAQEKESGVDKDEESERSTTEIKLNFSDIMFALREIK
ncbi:unnamed protein product [Phytomonas sp. Hart1]|nr:unnamed protein product [Phytomonas sp. Hart1]|eukprot:CCW67588.1 unnamed protein product [Phytomonas sp. isolate Hart1]